MMKYFKYFTQQLKFSLNFKEKLNHNFHELTWIERIVYWVLFRFFIEKSQRFFFEGCIQIPGQMYIEDRKLLYNTIIKYKPGNCFEVGTYTGGGSTFFLANAFYKLGKGKLYTIENDRRLYKKAISSYNKYLSHLVSFIEFVYGDEISKFGEYILERGVESVFLDGAEDGRQTMDQFLQFQEYFKPGCILMTHDWNTEKTSLLKPYILSNQDWELVEEVKPPLSVGFVVFKKIK